MNRTSSNWDSSKEPAGAEWPPARPTNTSAGKTIVPVKNHSSTEPRRIPSLSNLLLFTSLLALVLILGSCQFTRHGVARSHYRDYRGNQNGESGQVRKLLNPNWEYMRQDGDVPLKVLVYKGRSLDKKNHNLYLDGNNLVYGSKEYPLENDLVTLQVERGNPVVFHGNYYFGEITVARKNYVYVVNTLPLEEYLVGVVRKEISYSWPEEAIKAQAVAARSYAYRKYLENFSKPYHLRGDTSDQVFGGSIGVHESIIAGVEATRGRILVYDDFPILTFFHASCGGMTEKAKDVWPTSEDLPYFQNIRCNYCTTHPLYSWEFTAGVETVLSKLSDKIGKPVSSFYVEKLSGSGRVAEMAITTSEGKKTITGNEFRLAVGPSKLYSTKFKIKRKGDEYVVTGNGYGHGVGLCQWGAKTMAERGFSDERILNFYYKKIRFSTVANIEKKLQKSVKIASR